MTNSRPASSSPGFPAALVRDLEPRLLRYARHRVRTDEQAREIVQETWLAALASYGQYAGRASFRTWVTAILRRKIIDSYRSRRPTESFREAHHLPGDGLPRRIEARAETRAVLNAMDRLTPRERQAVELCGVEELERDEAAARMGLSRPCLRVTLCRGRKRLRAAMAEDAA